MKDRFPLIKRVTEEIVQKIKEKIDGKTPTDILSITQQITGNVILQSFFGKDFHT